VPNAPRNAGHENAGKTGDHLPFEAALKRLEGIVEEMESQDLPLDSLLAKYEEGKRLSRMCQEKLASAEVRIQQLEQNAAGEMKLKPLSGAPSSAE
jgi:exodeoxyribonuclease VII small subunit